MRSVRSPRRPLFQRSFDRSGLGASSPTAPIHRSKSPIRTVPRSGIQIPESSSEEEHRGELYKDLHERYLELHQRVSRSKFELQQLRKQYAEKVESAKFAEQTIAHVDLEQHRSDQLMQALKHILDELQTNPSITRERKAAIMRKHLYKLTEWSPRLASLLRFVESQVTLTTRPPSSNMKETGLPSSKHWAP